MSRTTAVRRFLAILAGTAILGLAAPEGVAAQRKGFVLNLGAGVAMTNLDFGQGESRNRVGVATDFKIGYAPTDQLLIYYSNDASFFTIDDFEDNLTVSGVSAIGASWFLQPAAPTFFFDAAIGLAGLTFFDTADGDSDGYNGLGVAIGAGYEFARHWLIDVDLIFGSPGEDGFSVDTRTIRFAINWLLY